MSRSLRSPSLVDDVVGGLDFRSRETCTFLTFGKAPTTPRAAVVPPPSRTGSTRVQPPTTPTNAGAYNAGNGRERKSSTETGPPDPSAVRRPCGSESTSRPRCPSPDDDDDDVFPVTDVGCSSMTCSRSISVPPRRTHSCAQPVGVSEVPPPSDATSTVVVSPPKMKRRKKKSAPETEAESKKVGSSMSLGRNNSVLPIAARCSSRVTEVTKLLPRNETSKNSYDGTNSDSLPVEQPTSELSGCRENSFTPRREPETKRKKNIRWKADVAQSSPDVASDDADSKESGYITLEDLQAQLGLSSWSSDERQTDQDVFSSSGDELRAPEGLDGGALQLTSSMSSTFGAPSTDLVLPPPSSSSSFLTPLMPPDQFDSFSGGADCCRSAPPTCDASLLKFTFTVRLDSKMFHRRTANKSVRRYPPPLMMVTDVQERGWSGASTNRDKELPKPSSSGAETSATDDQTKPIVNTSPQVAENCVSPPPAASVSSPERQNTQISGSATSAAESTLPADSTASSSSAAVQQFAGEKMVVKAEVHRSADQLEPSKSSSAVSNGQKSKSKSSAVHAGGASSQRETARRVADRTLSASCQPDDIIVSCCSPEAEFLNRQCSMTQSLHHDRSDKVADGALNGRLNYVDVDRVVSQTAKRQTFDRQQSSTSATSQRSNRLTDGLALTLRKPAKLRHHADRCPTDARTKKEKRTNEVGTTSTTTNFIRHKHKTIDLGDGGTGAGMHLPPMGKIRQLLCKTREFSDKNRVKFRHFVNFSYIFSGKNILPPKLTELLYAYAENKTIITK